MKKWRLTVQLDPTWEVPLRHLAVDQEISLAEWIRRAIMEKWLKETGKMVEEEK